MRLNTIKRIAKKIGSGATVLLLAAGFAHANEAVNLTAGPTSANLPDGSSVPMWGYTCGTPVAGSLATCTALNPAAATAGLWSPVVITVPTGSNLQINLSNRLVFGPSATSNKIPTSLVIVGQIGGGLGDGGTTTASPQHNNQGATWPIQGTDPAFTPPAQLPRVQSFATEVPAGSAANALSTRPLTWLAPNPGTYLMESGTHPSIQASMGLVGMVVVTSAPSSGMGTAYPAVSYSSEVPLLFSEIDPAQNIAVYNAVRTAGFKESSVHGNFGGPVNGVVVTNGGTGYKAPPKVNFSTGAPSAAATATIDTDPNSPTVGQVTGVTVDSPGTYASTASISFQPDLVADPTGSGSGAAAIAVQGNAKNLASICSDGAAACYPPVVNYAPRYYLINGAAFDKTNVAASVVAATPSGSAASPIAGTLLVRMVNAGSRMHVPSIVGAAIGGKGGMGLIAEDGNPLPGTTRVQNEVFMAAGKTYDVTVDMPAVGKTAYPVFDRQGSLSANGINRDAGMLAYIGANGNGAPLSPSMGSATANPDNYAIVLPCASSSSSCTSASIPDASKGVLANDINVFGVKVVTPPTQGTLALNTDGTFSYTPNPGWTGPDTFMYCGNGASANSSSSHPCETVTLAGETMENAGGITCSATNYASNVATKLKVNAPGVLANCKDALGFPLTATKLTAVSGSLNVSLDKNGSFVASVPPSGAGSYNFTFTPQNSQGVNGAAVQVSLTFPQGGGLTVKVVDGTDKTTEIKDYRWILEEDRTFYQDPKCTTNPPPAGCPGAGGGIVPTFGTNFHTSFMPTIATGCTGTVSCGSGQKQNGVDLPSAPISTPADVALCGTVPAGTPCLDPRKRYYISVLPGDAAQPFLDGYAGPADCSGQNGGECGHGMGGAPIPATPTAQHDSSQQITVLTEPSPYPPATLTAFVFEDDYPLNGEHDAGGGLDVLAPNEPGLGGFNITLQDNAGGTGDATGQPTYDMFNMPLSNSLAGTIDPVTGFNACPISRQVNDNQIPDPNKPGYAMDGTVLGSQSGIVGQIVTCPKYEDGKDASGNPVLSPLAGQAVVKNLYQGRYGVVAMPGADRFARGEEWLQTNTLDGQKGHDSFMRIGEPGYFQEFGPAGYHVTIGFANPAIINGRGKSICSAQGADCSHEVKGHVTLARMSRVPDERLYGSGNRNAYGFTQCYVSIGDPDGADFGFSKCDDQGNFLFPKGSIPSGNWKITTFDQWNDQVVDGITTPVGMCAPQSSIDPTPINPNSCHDVDMGEVAVHQWQSDIYTRTFIDLNGDGVSNVDANGNPTEPGLALAATNVRFRDGSFSNFNSTDLNGYAGFNEVFPLFNWYIVETDFTRYKSTGTHVVYDAGGPVDGSSPNGVSCADSSTKTKPCGGSMIADSLANTYEPHPLPGDLHVPGAVYCTDADCTNQSIKDGPNPTVSPNSTGRIDPPWVHSEGWQSFMGQGNFLEFGKKPFADGENGGIWGHVVYASTRPFDDPQLLLQLSWEPMVPHVRINLYKEGLAADNVTQTLTLVDHTETSSWDDWAQGFRQNPDGSFVTDGHGNFIPNMSCPGQGTNDSSDPLGDPYFWLTIKDQPQYLDVYDNNGAITKPLAHDSQFKCYDGMHNWNQLQPAPYDGMYSFPSVTSMDPVTGKPVGTNCTGCTTDPDSTDTYRYGTPMLPDGKYVVEVVVPPGYELVKEEDKNILIGDNFVAPVTQQFGGLGSIFILPDQAEIDSAYNSNNNLNATDNLGRDPSLPSHEGDTGTDESFWPCVGEARVVPDFISLFPGSQEVAPFAGATRHLCDRKAVTLTDQTSVLTKFYVFTETHAAAHFTGLITDDLQAEFDPYSPAFGEKYAPPYMPIGIKDWAGNEVNRVYADAYGAYDGLNYSSWEVNPPNPTGYGPTTLVYCMNDTGVTATNPAGDPLFHKGYSDFCYELPGMPAQTGYFDTPVVPTAAFANGYNNPDCSYPDATPAVSKVKSVDIDGPWVSAAGHQLTITALGDQIIDNPSYAGPQATTAPFNKQRITRHYGFGPIPTDFSSFQAAPVGKTYTCNNSSVNGICPYVTIGGKAMTGVVWMSDGSKITGLAPSGVPDCAVQQQAQYGGSHASCGQLSITAASGKQSIDSVSVTIGGKTPTVLAAGQTIQQAIDVAAPGDMILIPTGTYQEMVIMWKPVRLQGVGAVSSVIDGNPHPAGRLDPWRRQMVCLFGLALDGQPSTGTNGKNPFDPSGTYSCPNNMQYFSGGPDYPTMVVDRIPMEGILGWDTTVNGNLAEQLIEPGLLGAYEGGGITVLAKGVKIPAGQTDVWGSGSEAAFPAGTVTLTTNDCNVPDPNNPSVKINPYPGNYLCNPSSIDGVTIRNASQGGGGIYVHAWAHNLQVSNNRVNSNQGTMSGGITIGQGEHVEAPLVGGAAAATTVPPGSCINPDPNVPANVALPFCYDLNVNVHNNSVTQNASLGDELFSSTPAGAGGVTFCNGSDYYKFNFNWVCGNMSTGDGAGVVHLGFSYDGEISHNTILFNQSANPTISTNGGGLLVMGAPDPDPPCSETNDQDCVPDPASITPSDGTGPGLLINANLIQGNSADAGSGGGLRLQHVNGNDVINFPNGKMSVSGRGGVPVSFWPDIDGHTENTDARTNVSSTRRAQALSTWNQVTVTNNVITNNVAGWDGGGVSLLDAMAVNFVNNTVTSNNSTASAGVLFQTLFAPLASASGNNCTTKLFGEANKGSCPQPAGLVTLPNTLILIANMKIVSNNLSAFTCPTGYGVRGTAADCTKFSVPNIANDIFWQNRSFMIGEGPIGTGLVNQQTAVSLYNPGFTGSGLSPTLVANQTATGSCNDTNASFWDIGVRGDQWPGDHSSGGALTPMYSAFSNNGNLKEGSDPSNLNKPASLVKSMYCNGSRWPVEAGGTGWLVPPGTNESNALPAPPFTLQPGAVVDEGNNWINLQWGPLVMTSPADGHVFNNPVLNSNSAANDDVPSTSPTFALAPKTDFYGNPRPDPNRPNVIDIGAVEHQAPAPTLTSITPNTGNRGYSVNVTFVGTGFAAGGAVTLNAPTSITASNIVVGSDTSVTAKLTIASTAAVSVTQVGLIVGAAHSNTLPFTITSPPAPTITSITQNAGRHGTTVQVTITGADLLTAYSITISGGTGGAVFASNITPLDEHTVKANFVIPSTASNGPRTFTVTAIGGISNALTFTVAQPTLTSIMPGSSMQGVMNLPVTLSGQFLTGATGLTGLGNGVAVVNGTFHVVNDSTITANLNIQPSATTGVRNVAAVIPFGNSTTVDFTISTPPVATIASITPTSGVRGSTIPVTLTGTNFTFASTILAGNGVAAGPKTFNADGTQVSTTFLISNTAAVGAHNVTVTNASNIASNAVTFTVTAGTPTLTASTMITDPGNLATKKGTVTLQNSATGGTAGPLTLTAVPTIAATGGGGTWSIAPGSTCTSGMVLNPSDTCVVNALYTYPTGSSAGTPTARVTISDTGSFTGTTVQLSPTLAAAGPVLVSINPASFYRGQLTPVTLTGYGLTGTTSIGGGSGFMVSNITVVDDHSVTANVAVDPAAVLGTRNLTVTASGRTSAPIPISVTTTPAAATITSISPASGTRGTTITVTLTGTNFTWANTITAGSGVSPGPKTFNPNGTQVSAPFTISNTAPLGVHNVVVTNASGTASAPITFTVN